MINTSAGVDELNDFSGEGAMPAASLVRKCLDIRTAQMKPKKHDLQAHARFIIGFAVWDRAIGITNCVIGWFPQLYAALLATGQASRRIENVFLYVFLHVQRQWQGQRRRHTWGWPGGWGQVWEARGWLHYGRYGAGSVCCGALRRSVVLLLQEIITVTVDHQCPRTFLNRLSFSCCIPSPPPTARHRHS